MSGNDSKSQPQVARAVVDYFRCPEEYARFGLAGELRARAGFFRFGLDLLCYGQTSADEWAATAEEGVHDLSGLSRIKGKTCYLPFDPSAIITNLREERYVSRQNGSSVMRKVARPLYYSIRPFLGVGLRKHLQRLQLRGWEDKLFPHWPVDQTADRLLERLLAMSMRAQDVDKVPFVWFWPAGWRACAIMTHDVEEAAGRDFCLSLMDLDEAAGIKSSFQFVPEKRYPVSSALLGEVRERGFEVNVHDLNHDGRLYDEREEFLRRAEKINHYARKYRALGFRSGVLYRNLDWYDAYELSYDMSVPNVAHLDPQAGGCCTTKPYFIGRILELPLATTQDYTLFHILSDFTTARWEEQMKLIADSHGLVSFNVHPDYIIEDRARGVYCELLSKLSRFCSEKSIWLALPKEVDRWWRERNAMELVESDGGWRVRGAGADRAVVAYASLAGDGSVAYTVAPQSPVTH